MHNAYRTLRVSTARSNTDAIREALSDSQHRTNSNTDSDALHNDAHSNALHNAYSAFRVATTRPNADAIREALSDSQPELTPAPRPTPEPLARGGPLE